jgi:hypothetical protein
MIKNCIDMKYSQDALFLLSILGNYRKYETPNLYSQRISEINPPQMLQAILLALKFHSTDLCKVYDVIAVKSDPTLIGKFVGMVSYYVTPATPAPLQDARYDCFLQWNNCVSTLNASASGAFLLAFYEFIYLNKSFCHVLSTIDNSHKGTYHN